ncbi:DNA polymerase III subunit chi [Pseudomonas chlororaphis]|uniref:DNA polymerase III subunit chi n=1 Tax=Pseudomonas chlororaphis TaxID=587753 RepID=A0A1Q8EW75_9PSED|nr:DNA polymerase III subunit chi [Pseudomonas chlororaphis]OLF56022.1 DNA polymerase III subunit chi [Pseudomonas chlororaphis]
MDTPKPLQKSAHLLDDLESIRQLLGDENLQPPLLTETVDSEVQIPLLFDMVGGNAAAAVEEPAAPPQPLPVQAAEPQPEPAVATPAPPPALTPAPAPAAKNQDTLLHLDSELRAAAQLIMQDVIDDFAPHIETEIKRRLDARMERLLSQYQD